MSLTVDYVEMSVAALFEKGLLLGLYLATFVHSLRWLMFEDKGWKIRKVNPIMILATVLVFGLTVVSFVGDMVMTFLALHLADNHFSRTGIPTMLCVLGRGTIFIVFNTVLIYRCWIISFKKWYIICLPVALWFTSLINSIIASYCYWHAVFPNVQKSLPALCDRPAMSITSFACNVVISVYTTCAIVYQILIVTKYSRDKRRLYNICRILTESGILYTISTTVYLITVEEVANLGSSDTTVIASSVAQSLTLPLVLYLPGIAFNLITIRTGQQRASSVDWTETGNASELPNYSSPTVIHKEVYVEHTRTDVEEFSDVDEADTEKTDTEKTDVETTDSGQIQAPKLCKLTLASVDNKSGQTCT